MRHLLYIIMCASFAIGCSSSDKGDREYEGIPSTAQNVAENDEYIIFLNDEDSGDSIEGLGPIKQVSVWTYDKSKRSAKIVLLSHPHTDVSWFSTEHSVTIPLDSIPTISKVTILSWSSEPLKLLAEGCSDYRNVESFIIDINSDLAICLPTNRGLIGVSEEEGLLIMQSYAYYEGGERYNIIEAFDQLGNRITSMDAKMSQ